MMVVGGGERGRGRRGQAWAGVGRHAAVQAVLVSDPSELGQQARPRGEVQVQWDRVPFRVAASAISASED